MVLLIAVLAVDVAAVREAFVQLPLVSGGGVSAACVKAGGVNFK